MDCFGVCGLSLIQIFPMAHTSPSSNYLKGFFQGFTLSSLRCKGTDRVADVFWSKKEKDDTLYFSEKLNSSTLSFPFLCEKIIFSKEFTCTGFATGYL